MANSIYTVHEMINKVGFEFDESTAKKVTQLAEKAGRLAADNMTTELSGVIAEIGNIFNKALTSIGKQPIDLANMIKTPDIGTIAKLTNSFVSQLSANINSGLEDVGAQFDALIKKRNQAVQEMEKLQNQSRIKTEATGKLDKAYNELVSNRRTSTADDAQFVMNAQDALAEFMDINDELLELEENGKVNASVLQKWLATAKELSTVYNTIQKMDALQRQKITPQVGKVTMQYFLEGQYDDDIEYGTSLVDDFIDQNDVTDALESAKKKVADLNTEISNLTNQHPELVNKKSALEAEERLNRVKEAYDRLLVTRGKNKGNLSEKGMQAIHAALEYNPKGGQIPTVDKSSDSTQMLKAKKSTEQAIAALDKLGNAYVDSEGSSWEVRAQHLLKFVKEYESLMNNPDVNKDLISGWSDTYQELKPMFAEYEDMLSKVYNVAKGKEALDTDRTGVIEEVSDQKRIADEVSAEASAKARLETEAKVKAEKEAADTARIAAEETARKAEEERKAAEAAEQKRLADEKAALAAQQAAEAARIEASEKEAMRKELIGRLDKYDDPNDGNGLDAKSMLAERKAAFEVLEKEGWITDEIRQKYESVNQSIKEKTGLLRKTADEQNKLNVVDGSNNEPAKVVAEKVETEVIEQQNDALKENIDLKARASGQGDVVSTPSKKTTATKTQTTVPDIVSSSEVNELDAIQSKLKDVTAAVNTKTQAFTEEEKEVKRVALAEVEHLEPLEKKISEIQNKLTNLLNDINTKPANIDADSHLDDEFKQEGQVAKDAINEELDALQKLRASINLTTKAVNSKTDAFSLEGKAVGQVVGKEISALMKLNTQVKDVNNQVIDLLKNLKNAKTAGQQMPKPQQAPQNNNPTPHSGGGGSRNNQVDYSASNKLREQSVLKLRAELLTTNKLTNSLEQGLTHLYTTASKITDKSGLDDWNRILKEIRGNLGIKGIFDKSDRLDEEDKYKNLIALKQLEYELEKKLLNIKGTNEEAVVQKQLQQTKALITSQAQLTKGSEQYVKLKQKEAEWTRNIERLTAHKKDAEEAQVLKAQEKQEADRLREQESVVKKLLPLYRQLGEAKIKEVSATNSAEKTQASNEVARIRGLIRSERYSLQSSKDVEDKFLQATNDGKTKQRTSELQSLITQYSELGKLQAQADHSGTAKTKEKVDRLQKEIDAKTISLKLTQAELAAMQKITLEAKDAETKLLSADERDETLKQQIKDQQKLARTTKAANAINKATDAQTSLMTTDGVPDDVRIDKITELDNKLKELNKTYQLIQNSKGSVNPADIEKLKVQTAETDKLTNEVNELINQYKRLSGSNTKVMGDAGVQSVSDPDALRRQLIAHVQAYTTGKAVIGEFDAATGKLSYTVKGAGREVTSYTAELRGLDKQYVTTQGTTKKTEGFFQSILRKTKEIGAYFSGSSLVYKAINEVKKGIQYVREIDSALTELKKVTDETDESYERFLNTAAKTGARIGSTISDFTQATAEFARLGYNIDLASEMAEAAIVYTNVGDGIESVSAASESIISTMKGFGLETSESMAIVDRFNEVGNRFAITSKGIGDALQRSASALAAAGNTIDESIGLVTAANTVVQDPESVGKKMCRH